MMSHDPPRRPEPSPRRVLLFFVVLSAAIAGAIGGLRGGGGDPVATLDLSRGPSSAPVSLRAGDLLRVRADLEFRHRASQLRGNPDGCEVTLSLREGTATRVQTRCALFPEVAVGASSSARWEPDGRVWRRLEGQRLACAITAPGAGSYTVEASSTLARCLPALVEARITLTR
jgi:hypothetical protein